jgi:hypothetical protein
MEENRNKRERSQYYDNDDEERDDERFERRRTIRDVRLDEELRDRARRFERTSVHEEGQQERPQRTFGYYRRGMKPAGYVIALFAVLLLIFGGFLYMSYFGNATVTVVPRTAQVLVDEELTVSTTPREDMPLVYEVFSVSEEASQALPVQGEERREVRATGRITIYNTFSGANQTLVTNTRFKSEAGNIYRVLRSVVVPGVRPDGSPGRITVEVTSDRAGEEYNLPRGRFTIPGLEGTPLHEAMYAEVAEPITGGFVGAVPVVDEEKESTARETNRRNLEAKLLAKVGEVLPPDYLFVSESSIIEYTDLPNEFANDSARVKTRGTLYGVMFNKNLLAGYFAGQHVERYDNKPVTIGNPHELTINLVGEDLGLDDIQNEINLVFSGNVEIVWVIDTDHLKSRLAGISRNNFHAVIQAIPSIRDARLELAPGLLRSIPSSAGRIQILIEDSL